MLISIAFSLEQIWNPFIAEVLKMCGPQINITIWELVRNADSRSSSPVLFLKVCFDLIEVSILLY